MSTDYVIRRGETLRLSLLSPDGVGLTDVVTIVAKMKKAGPNGSVPPSTEPVIATLTTQSVTLGWDFLLTDEQTSVMKEGIYIVDAKLDLLNGDVLKTSAVTVNIKPSVS